MVLTSMIVAEAVHPPCFAMPVGSKCQLIRTHNIYSESWLSSLILQSTARALRKHESACDKSNLVTPAFVLPLTINTAF